jgi:hypothetical protein
LRGYCNTVRRSGKTSAKTRQALVAEFNGLAKADFACLNVSDDKAGFGLVRAKEIVSDFKAAERDWLATFQANQTKAQASLDLAQAKANAKAKTQSKGKGKTRKAYSVDGKGKAKGKDGSVFVRHEAKPIPSALTVAPMTPATVS